MYIHTIKYHVLLKEPEEPTDSPTTDETTTDSPATDETTTDSPTTDETTTDSPTTDEATTDSPTTDETATTPDETPTTGTPSTSEFDNCEMLHTSLSLEWTVDRSSQSIRFRLCGCTSPDSAE